ncbi:nuclear RNA export factor 2 [Sigmodon hispidus]
MDWKEQSDAKPGRRRLLTKSMFLQSRMSGARYSSHPGPVHRIVNWLYYFKIKNTFLVMDHLKQEIVPSEQGPPGQSQAGNRLQGDVLFSWLSFNPSHNSSSSNHYEGQYVVPELQYLTFGSLLTDSKPSLHLVLCLETQLNTMELDWFPLTQGSDYVPQFLLLQWVGVWLYNIYHKFFSNTAIAERFHVDCDRHQIRFFVQDAGTACALKDVSYKMCDGDSQKIPIFVNLSDVPYSVKNRFTGKQMKQLKLTLRKRYDVSQHVLDLQKLRFDPGFRRTLVHLLIPFSPPPEDLVGHNIDMVLNRRSCMAATLQIIQEDFPEVFSLNLSSNKLFRLDSLFDVVEKAPRVKILNLSENELKTAWELEKIKGLRLEELWLEGNPLCSTFPDRSAYVSLLQKALPCLISTSPDLLPGPEKVVLTQGEGLLIGSPFSFGENLGSLGREGRDIVAPSLIELTEDAHYTRPLVVSSVQDGRNLPLSSVMDFEESDLRKPCKESIKGSEAIKNQVQQFLQEYYMIYDYGERQGLLSFYHDKACFSLTIPFNPSDADLSGMGGYFQDEVDMKNPKELCGQRQLLKYTKQDIVGFLRAIPQTLHAFSSFQVNMCFQSETMSCFSVSGLFKEREGSSQGHIRAFMRTFIFALDRRSSNLCIVNDQLFVRNPSHDELQSAFAIALPTSSSSFRIVLSQEQQRMVQAFSIQSGMKLEWSQKCLEDNNWDYNRAAEVFTMLQTKSKIPKEFFKEMT